MLLADRPPAARCRALPANPAAALPHRPVCLGEQLAGQRTQGSGRLAVVLADLPALGGENLFLERDDLIWFALLAQHSRQFGHGGLRGVPAIFCCTVRGPGIVARFPPAYIARSQPRQSCKRHGHSRGSPSRCSCISSASSRLVSASASFPRPCSRPPRLNREPASWDGSWERLSPSPQLPSCFFRFVGLALALERRAEVHQ